MNLGHSANKKSKLEELLNLGMVLVALDARCEGVDVPDHLAQDPQLRLNLSYRFGLPMAIDPWGISATLTFGGIPHACRFPWRAVFLMVSHINGEPYLYPSDVPSELVQQGPSEGRWSLREAIVPTPATRKPRLCIVPSPPAGELPPEETHKPRKRSRRATGSGFSAAARRAARDTPAEEPPAPSEPSLETPPPPPTDGRPPGRSRHHLRVVK